MSLNPEIRGVLDLLIDGVISQVAVFAKSFLDPKTTSRLHIKSSNDFSSGVAVGMIVAEFNTLFISTYGRGTSEQELSEVSQVILRRMPEIRDAVFRAG
jgi:hypothetical protein